MSDALTQLRERGVLSPLDQQFARALGRLAEDESPEVLLAAALALRQVRQGDVCVDLSAGIPGEPAGAEDGDGIVWPAFDEWRARLASSPLVATGASDSAEAGAAPLVLDASGRLYLRRLFDDERRLAHRLGEHAARFEPEGPEPPVRAAIERLLPPDAADGGRVHWPRVAASVALARGLCVISGRPGTGKTTTAARLLAVLVERALAAASPAPRIALAAPTGKAAARLAEAIGRALEQMEAAEPVLRAIPRQAVTLHRLLRVDPRGRRRTSTGARLPADVVLVDEASMVDLEMAARLVDALHPDAKLILLGDPDQLASVEAGSVFADVCGPSRAVEYGDETAAWIGRASGQHVWVAQSPAPAIRDCVVTLEASHRYAETSGIGALARAVQSGEAERAVGILTDDAFPDVVLRASAPADDLAAEIVEGYADFANAAGPGEALAGLERFRVLCAVRDGAFGVEAWNRRAEALLVASGGLPARPWDGGSPCRPVLVTRNAPHLGLFNGDVGVFDRSEARVWFQAPEAEAGALRGVAAGRLPTHEAVFAMTVHKSQGSEFDALALVLPDEPIPLLTRELVYTAVTRARRRLVVYARPEVLSAAVRRPTRRASGLREALWGGSG